MNSDAALITDRRPISRWKRFRFQLEILAARGLKWLLPKLSRRTVCHIGRLAGWLAYRFGGPARRIALANLDLAFGDERTRADKERIALASMQNFMTTLLTLFWFPRLQQRELMDVVDIDAANLRHVRELQAQGKPIIFITLHYGDWEMLGLVTCTHGFPVTTVSRTMRNTGLEEIFTGLRSQTGNRVLPRRFAAAKLLKALKRGEWLGLLIDQHVPERLGGIWCDFFGVPVLTTPAIAQLALHSGATILGAVARPVGDRLQITYGPEIPYTLTGDKHADIQTITQQCLAFCETVIRQQPEAWLWSYKRWKARPTETLGRYPFYSSCVKRSQAKAQ
jgi:KDO2-lipid IV(A) lauroyltransferase